MSFTMATCFSGIGAPEIGAEGKFEPVWSAEIEPFPAAVLAARFGASAPRYMPSPDDDGLEPDDVKSRRAALKAVGDIVGGSRTVNLGDVSNPAFIDDALALGKIDLLVGGPPCQAFSFAGLRQSLGDRRGNLSLRFVEIAHAIRPRILLVENVPGWLSTDDNAFGCFLGAIVGGDAPLDNPLDGKWPDSGMVAGPRARIAWRLFDAQYFGLAQRRRRVFAVVCFGDDDPVRILFEWKRMQGNSKPSRKARQGGEVAGTLGARSKGGGGLGTDFELDGGLQPVGARQTAYGAFEMNESASTFCARDYKDARDLVINCAPDVAGTLKGEGFDATDERSVGAYILEKRETVGTICADSFSGGAGGRPEGAAAGHFIPQVAFAIQERAGAENLTTGPQGKGFKEEVAYTVEARRPQSVAFALRGRDGGAMPEVSGDIVGAQRASEGGSTRDYVATRLAVRRLTPTECERLQGFPDGFTAIEGKKFRKVSEEVAHYLRAKGLPVEPFNDETQRTRIVSDGPRYKALGNSWAVPCGAWIINRIYLDMKGEL